MAKDKSEKTSEKNDKPTKLDELKALIEKNHGAGSIMRGRGGIVNVDVIPTGVISIDVALGIFGIPQGRILEIYGAESSGKTTTCLQLLASAQKHYFDKKQRYGRAALIDAEHAFDSKWAAKCGVDMDELFVSQPDSGEQALQICETLIESKEIDLIVVDSVAALVPRKVLEGEIGDSVIGAQAQLMSQGLNRLKGKCNKTMTTVIFINQIREKIGVTFGNPETTPGGRALKFYSSVRMEVRKGSAVKINEVVVGFKPTLKIVKNKVAPPFTTAEYDICTGTETLPIFGIDSTGSLIDFALDKKILDKRGNFISYPAGNNVILGNGRAKAIIYLKENKDILDEISKKTYDAYRAEIGTIGITEQDGEEYDEPIEV
jgi:recombination protein RecA